MDSKIKKLYLFLMMFLFLNGVFAATTSNKIDKQFVENTINKIEFIKDYQLPADAKNIQIIFNSERKLSGGYNMLGGPGGPITPSDGDIVSYTYTQGGYRIQETWEYKCDSSGCSWYMTQRTMKLATELQ